MKLLLGLGISHILLNRVGNWLRSIWIDLVLIDDQGLELAVFK